MVTYSVVRQEGRTYIFAKECDFTSQIEIDTTVFSAQELLQLFAEHQVAPEQMQNVYEDLLFGKNMV